MQRLLSISTCLFLGFLTASAAPTTAPSRTPSPAPSASTAGQNPSPTRGKVRQDRLLWDTWYTVTVNKNVHYAYYNDRVELKGGRVHFQNHFWKNEEGYLNEEQLGAFAMDDQALTPLFFNFHSTYRSTETTIDGNIGADRTLSVRIRKGNTDLPIVKKPVPAATFFSVFFPLWIGYRLPTLKPGHPLSFSTLLEDNLEVNYSLVHGRLRLDSPDAIAQRTKTQKLLVVYRDLQSVWYVYKNGMPYRIEMPAQKTVIQRVSKETAQKFLDE